MTLSQLTPEQEALVRSVRKLVDFWQIEAHELAPDAGAAPVVKAAPEPAPEPSGPKYRHPITGETWDGEGSQPQWLREALIKEGYLVEELRLAGADAATPDDGRLV